MKYIKVAIFLFLLLLPLLLFSQDGYRDPFEPLLPKEEEPMAPTGRGEIKGPPPVTVEGVLWGTDIPQTIIDGEVYKVGDKLKNLNASIFKIVDNVVFISYGDKIHKMEIKKR